MAGALKVTIRANLTGLGKEININPGEATMTTPVEHGGSGKYIVHATAQETAIQVSELFPQIALAKMYGVYIKAEAGTIYIMVDTAGTTTFAAAAADLVLNVGEACWLPINPAGNLGLTIDASAVTDAFTITVVGKA